MYNDVYVILIYTILFVMHHSILSWFFEPLSWYAFLCRGMTKRFISPEFFGEIYTQPG